MPTLRSEFCPGDRIEPVKREWNVEIRSWLHLPFWRVRCGQVVVSDVNATECRCRNFLRNLTLQSARRQENIQPIEASGCTQQPRVRGGRQTFQNRVLALEERSCVLRAKLAVHSSTRSYDSSLPRLLALLARSHCPVSVLKLPISRQLPILVFRYSALTLLNDLLQNSDQPLYFLQSVIMQ